MPRFDGIEGGTTVKDYPTEAGAPKRARSDLQERVLQALEMSQKVDLDRREGSPDMIPEVDREVTMLEGALQGIYQRVGEVVAACEPVLHPKALHAICEEPTPRPGEETFELGTTLGRRLREIQYHLTEIEHALSYLGQGIRL